MNDVRTRRIEPEWIVVKAFAATILVGTLLIALPWSSAGGKWTDPLTAFFTATSAVCVTGLSVVDIGTTFSLFGQVVIVVLIQAGGLGIMTLGTFLLVLVGRRLSVENEFVLMDSLGQEGIRGLRALVLKAVTFTVLIELAGAVILGWRLWAAHGYRPVEAAYSGVFHSISAFCNAGFSLYRDSLAGLRRDSAILATVACLIVVGGLGFLVLHNLSSIRFWRRDLLARGRMSLHTKIVLATSAVLIVLGTLTFLVLEHNGTLAGLSWKDKAVCSLFQGTVPRTAGFSAVNLGQVKPATLFSTMGLMFIGGSPGSTAGGVKTTTLVVLILTVVAMIRGRAETDLWNRTIPNDVVREALTVFWMSVLCVGVVFGVLLLTEQPGLLAKGISSSDALLFETVSAFGTVGLSTGITPDLSVGGKLMIILCMFIGRVGPVSLVLKMGARDFVRSVRYPEEEVVVG
jgi:trk system potassium uptake protein TrkH